MKMIFGLVLVFGFSLFLLLSRRLLRLLANRIWRSFVRGIEPGDGRMMKCLHDNEAQLSSECQAKRSEMKEKMKGAHENCQEDVEKFCADVKPGGGRIVKCLKAA